MVDSLWLSNTAQYGGALYADEGCSLTVHNTTFASNYAQVPRSDPGLHWSLAAALKHGVDHCNNTAYPVASSESVVCLPGFNQNAFHKICGCTHRQTAAQSLPATVSTHPST